MQRLAPWVFILAFTAGGLALLFVQSVLGRPVGGNPTSDGVLILIVGIFSLALPGLLIGMKLEIVTNFDGVRVRFWPFVNRLIRYEEIETAVAKTYSPIREYGGWGVRGFGKRVAYNARGNQGVLLTLKDGATIMLGTQKPTELEAAITVGMRPR